MEDDPYIPFGALCHFSGLKTPCEATQGPLFLIFDQNRPKTSDMSPEFLLIRDFELSFFVSEGAAENNGKNCRDNWRGWKALEHGMCFLRKK